MVLAWYRRYHNDVMRGQLASAYIRAKEEKGFLYFCLGNLMLNWMTKPDFIAYDQRYVNNVSSLMSKNWSFSFMYAGYKDGDFISGFYDKTGSCYENDEAADLTYCKVIVVDNVTSGVTNVRVGDVRDIIDAHTVGNENCSRLLVNYVSAYMRCVVVYL